MLSRRQFFSLVASGVAADALLPFCGPELRAEIQDSEVHLQKRYVRQNKSYGSGTFGEWVADSHGLPCYQYTCDQTEDPVAITPVESAWRAATDQSHQIGNDRIIAAASNYGHIQVRQDEGGPKFLNDYMPAEGFFGAGIGYLTDGEEVLGTYFPGNGKSFDRFFGMGYLRKRTAGKNFSVDQTIYAPFGDDPVLISEVVITSQSPRPTNLQWTEYWGCQIYPFSYQSYVEGHIGSQPDPDQIAVLRRSLGSGFGHGFERLAGTAGLVETKVRQAKPVPHTGVAMQEEMVAEMAGSRGGDFTSSGGAERQELPAPHSDDDLFAPDTFLASLDDGPVSFLTNAPAFFGPATILRHTGAAGPDSVPVPEGLLRPMGLVGVVPLNAAATDAPADDLSATGAESALILRKPFTLEAGQSQTLRFIYGYLPKGFSAATLIAKYRAGADTLFARSSAAWKDEGIQFDVKDDLWVERETRWHNYYLRSGFSYDDYFGEHIVSQGQVYQYCIGTQGAARDSLQHVLPLVFGESELAKQVLRYTLKSQGPDGGLPSSTTGHGSLMPNNGTASDLDLWLLWVASEYVLATRDVAFLEEQLPSYPLQAGGPTLPVREMLARSYRHLIERVGVGKHGLLRGQNGDWNRNIYILGVPAKLHEEIGRESESVMNAAMAAYILDHYARMLRYAGDKNSATDVSRRAAQQREAVRAQWAGKWFKRLWFGTNAGWAGEDRLWLDGQPWAMLGDCATAEQRAILARSIDELLRKPSKIGAKQVSRPVDWPGFMPGESENGGVWAALGGPLIWALAGVDGAMAWDEWKKNSRANHAEVYRDVWYGIWSGPDVYCSADSEHAGQTGYDWGLIDPEYHRRPNNYRGLSWTAWPVMNMHRHAWPLYSAAKLLGLEFTEGGVDLAPSIPKPEYSFRSRLLGLEKSARGYQGWYAPQRAGRWTVRVRLPINESSFKNLKVNGSVQPTKIGPDNTVEFDGASTQSQALRWSLYKD